jgi:hypothetical protein
VIERFNYPKYLASKRRKKQEAKKMKRWSDFANLTILFFFLLFLFYVVKCANEQIHKKCSIERVK